MSSIILTGDTSGTVQIAAPAVAGTSVITLPVGSGTAAVQGVSTNIVSGTAQASTSGTSIDFTSIPSWVKRITVMFQGVSTSGLSLVIVQLGTGATPTYTTSGYLGAANLGTTYTSVTNGLPTIGSSTGADVRQGLMMIASVGSNSWVSGSNMAQSNTANGGGGGGSVSLSGQLTAVRITTVSGTDTFDAGSINILYE